MSDDEIKLTNKNNTTSNGTAFPETPKPQILNEHFAYAELNNDDNQDGKDNNNDK